MVLFGIIIFILAIALLSSQIETINFNRVAIIVLLLSGVLAFHAMWVGQLGSGVGIFNGLFQVTAVTQGIDLFIYIVSALVLLISETQVLKYQLNNEEPARTSMPVPLSKSYTTNFYLGGTSRYNQSDSPVSHHSRDSLLVLL
jgi:hypothetical protein